MDKPNPGSDEAIALGCSCSVLDNHHGRGFTIRENDEPLFWIDEKCPIHGKEEDDDDRQRPTGAAND